MPLYSMDYTQHEVQLRAWLNCESVCLAFMKPWVQSPIPHKSDVVVPTSNPSIWEIEAGGSDVQGHPQLQNDFMASLHYMRHHLQRMG